MKLIQLFKPLPGESKEEFLERIREQYQRENFTKQDEAKE